MRQRAARPGPSAISPVAIQNSASAAIASGLSSRAARTSGPARSPAARRGWPPGSAARCRSRASTAPDRRPRQPASCAQRGRARRAAPAELAAQIGQRVTRRADDAGTRTTAAAGSRAMAQRRDDRRRGLYLGCARSEVDLGRRLRRAGTSDRLGHVVRADTCTRIRRRPPASPTAGRPGRAASRCRHRPPAPSTRPAAGSPIEIEPRDSARPAPCCGRRRWRHRARRRSPKRG